MLVCLESFLLMMVVYIIFIMMFYKSKNNMEIMSSYECGFDPYSLTRQVFSYRFYMISILFIIFDVEISLLLPSPFLMGVDYSLWMFIIFILVLIVGLLYEYNYGSLEWLNNYN